MPAQEALPGLVAQGLGQIGGPDDVGEHEGAPDRDRAMTAIFQVTPFPLDGLDVHPCSEALEFIERGAQFEVGVLLVIVGSERPRQDRPRPGHFVWGAHLAPAADRRSEFADRTRMVALSGEDAPQRETEASLESR